MKFPHLCGVLDALNSLQLIKLLISHEFYGILGSNLNYTLELTGSEIKMIPVSFDTRNVAGGMNLINRSAISTFGF